MVTQPFASVARVTAKSLGMESLPMIEVPWPFEAKDADDVVVKALSLLVKPSEATA